MCNLHLQVEADSWAVHAGRAPDLSSRQGEDTVLPHTQVVERGRGGVTWASRPCQTLCAHHLGLVHVSHGSAD